MVCHKGNSLVCLSVIQPEVGELIYLRNGGCIFVAVGFCLLKLIQKNVLLFLPCIIFSDFLEYNSWLPAGTSLCTEYCKVLLITATVKKQSSQIIKSCFLTHNIWL